MAIRYAGSGQTMIPGDHLIFEFTLPSWATQSFWTTSEGASLKTALAEAVHSVTVSPIQGQERYGVVEDTEGVVATNPNLYSVSVKVTQAGSVDSVWTALLNALNQAISVAGKTGIVTPHYHNMSDGGGVVGNINWTPILILLGVGGLIYFLGRSRY